MPDYKKYYTIPAPPDEVYRALTIPTAIQLWTNEPVVMSEEPDTEFSLWSDSITGRNISFITDKQIVQQWYFGDIEPASIVTIKLYMDGANTSLHLVHTNIPEPDYEDIIYGWTYVYIASLIQFFKE
jgi:activator of HSP90 ATPase